MKYIVRFYVRSMGGGTKFTGPFDTWADAEKVRLVLLSWSDVSDSETTTAINDKVFGSLVEERSAWDAYVAAGLSAGLEAPEARHQADEMLVARRARFGEAK